MNDNNYKKEKDHLAVGLTKSPVFMGVNIKLFFGNLVLCTLLCLNAQTLLGIPLFIFIHLYLVKVSYKDPNYLFIAFHAFLKTQPVLNRWFWGKVNSYEPW